MKNADDEAAIRSIIEARARAVHDKDVDAMMADVADDVVVFDVVNPLRRKGTLGFRRTGGRWRIVHDHGSVPFDPAAGQASLGLKP